MAAMTHEELEDNLTFLSALQMLKRLAEKEALTEKEVWSVRKELKRRLHPPITLMSSD